MTREGKLNGMSESVDGRRGVTSVLGVVLLVAIAIVIGTTLAMFSLMYVESLNEPAPGVTIDATTTDGEIRFSHRAGAAIPNDELAVVVRTPTTTTRVPFGQSTLTGADGEFAAGERWRYCKLSEPGTRVTVQLVHEPSEAVVANVEQSVQQSRKTGLEYRCGSSARQVGRGNGWVTFNMTNYASETVEIVGIEVTSDSAASRLEGLNESGDDHTDVYIDTDPADGEFTFSPNTPGDDGIAYSSPSSGPFNVGATPEQIDLTSDPPYYFDTAVVAADETVRFSLYQFQTASGDGVDMRSAELTLTLEFADRESRTYSIVLPQERG
jgi:flagellin-like protein